MVKVLFVLNRKHRALESRLLWRTRCAPGGFHAGHRLLFSCVTQTGRVSSFPDPSSPLSLSSISLSHQLNLHSAVIGHRETSAPRFNGPTIGCDYCQPTQTNPNTIQLVPESTRPCAFHLYIYFVLGKMPFFVMAKQNMSVSELQEKLMEPLGQ